MRVLALTHSNYADNLDLILNMHRLRRRVFKDRLNWEVSVSGDIEIDAYDALHPTYLLAVTEAGSVVGCARLLPTTGPNMLADTFPALLGGGDAPRSPRIFESSRFCVDTDEAGDVARRGLREATYCMLAGILEWGLSRALEAVVTVTDVRFERILKRAGWPLERLAPPRHVGNTLALAGYLPVNDQALSAVRAAGEISKSVLTVARRGKLAA